MLLFLFIAAIIDVFDNLMHGIKNATNKGNPESESIAFITITRRKDPKSFQISVNVFNAYSLARNLTIVGFIFVCQRVIFRGFAWNQTVFVNPVNSGIS